MSDPNTVTLESLSDDAWLFYRREGDESGGRMIRAGEIKRDITEGHAVTGSLFTTRAICVVPGFTSEQIEDTMANAIVDEVEDADQVIARLPSVEMEHVKAALDRLWAAVGDADSAVYHEETGTYVLHATRYSDCDREMTVKQRSLMSTIRCHRGNVMVFGYTNWARETRDRRCTLDPSTLRWGTAPYHSRAAWLIDGVDVERNVERTFDLDHIGWMGPE